MHPSDTDPHILQYSQMVRVEGCSSASVHMLLAECGHDVVEKLAAILLEQLARRELDCPGFRFPEVSRSALGELRVDLEFRPSGLLRSLRASLVH